jgi:pimeloyl-ACP methyl ester carboxylesterase
MLVDLVQVTASDGLRLHGALETPQVAGTLRVPSASLHADFGELSRAGEGGDGHRREALVGEPGEGATGARASHSTAPSPLTRSPAASFPLPPGERDYDRDRDTAIDIWLCLHGTGSNFYGASTLAGIAPKLLAAGAAVLRANTRGHDVVSTGPSADGRWLQGAAFERIDESPRDLAAWIEFLKQRGYTRIGLLGHSMGAIKAIFALAADGAPDVAALVAASPPHLSYARFCASRRADLFRETYSKAKALFDQGRGDELMLIKFPLAYYVTAANYLDRYGPDERYNVLGLLGRVQCPTLVTYGSLEMQREVAFEGMSDEVEKLAQACKSLAVAVIAGADHQYTGCHDALCATIAKWQARGRGSHHEPDVHPSKHQPEARATDRSDT